MTTSFGNATVAAKFDAYPPHVRPRLLALRELIFETASNIPSAGHLEESLRWGQPAYITRNKSGSTIRIDWTKKHLDHYAIYFSCQTNLVEAFRSLFPNKFKFEGNRALVLALDDQIPQEALSTCIAASLTYHIQRKKIRHN